MTLPTFGGIVLRRSSGAARRARGRMLIRTPFAPIGRAPSFCMSRRSYFLVPRVPSAASPLTSFVASFLSSV
ncbi:MAG: hypothetical protein M3214_10400, partial [Actinomycetota bacterium]|nr:hypothetical protein [Actinomycetota bacterium]